MATITLKNLPDDIYERLKLRARQHRRSINGEAIHCLESVLTPKRITPEERLKRIRSVRPSIDPEAASAEEIHKAIGEGRP